MAGKQQITEVKGTAIAIIQVNQSDYISLSPTKWIVATQAIGIISKQGNSGGTFAHKDIAFEFAAWLSAEFKLYLIMEFQRLKDEENISKKQEWSLQRTLSKINYVFILMLSRKH